MDTDLSEALEALEEDEPEPQETEESDRGDEENMFAEFTKGGIVEEEPGESNEEDCDSDNTIKAGEQDTTRSEYLTEMAQYKVVNAPQNDTDSLVGGF
jgi:hypothetical protein